MTLLIHDLSENQLDTLDIVGEDWYVVSADGRFAPCRGCFGCWLKTPGYCFIKDELAHIGAVFGSCEKVVIISQNCYGGYSKGIKNVLDRSISTILPFFTYRGKMMHHRRRYRNVYDLVVAFYGDMTALEKETAGKLVRANQLNMAYRSTNLFFAESPDNLKEVLQ